MKMINSFHKAKQRISHGAMFGYTMYETYRRPQAIQNELIRLRDMEDGATLMEYIAIVGVILLVVLGVMIFLGGTIKNIFNRFNGQLNAGANG